MSSYPTLISENEFEKVIAAIREKLTKGTPRPVLVAISGVPGAGKTTLALQLVKTLSQGEGLPNFAMNIPMDGYHLYRAQLSALPNSEEAHQRRGAEWTFDP
eukprot:RCo040338